MALIAVPGGEIATIVTTLEMRARPRPAPLPPSPLRLVPWPRPAPERYRTLFARVGTPWLWFSRLAMNDGQLSAIIHDPAVAVFAVIDQRGIEVGMVELDFRVAATCQLAYFGLVPELAGQGHGRWMMALALAAAWRRNVTRVWVHTCTLDHPAALRFYQRAGFEAISRAIETFADPRITGVLPPGAAPQLPCLAASRR